MTGSRWMAHRTVLLHTALITSAPAVLPLARLALPAPLLWFGLVLGPLQVDSAATRAGAEKGGWRLQALGAAGLFVWSAALMLVAAAGT